MSRKFIEVCFETITPLWMGNAFQKYEEIRPSSLMGSLRFWFEVLCYAGEIVKKSDFDYKKGQFAKAMEIKNLERKILGKGATHQEIIEILQSNVSLPGIIFGTTGWKGLICIKSIEIINNKNKRPNLSNVCIPGRNISSLQHYFWGKFKVAFEMDDVVAKNIFYPLLYFMNKYGFWGGKWNIGLGRLNVVEIKENREQEINLSKMSEFGFSVFGKDNKKIDENLIKKVVSFDALTNFQKDECRIKLMNADVDQGTLENILQELIKRKAEERAKFLRNAGSQEEEKINKAKRHKVFGTVKSPPQDAPHGSKILPWVYRKGDKYAGGFISVTSLLNLY